MFQNARVTVFTVSELFRKNQQIRVTKSIKESLVSYTFIESNLISWCESFVKKHSFHTWNLEKIKYFTQW